MNFKSLALALASPWAGAASLRAEDEAVVQKKRRRGVYRGGAKRLLDIAAVVLAAPAVVPAVAGLAVLAAKDGGAPFYSQLRIGKDGREFRMWKLRTMVPGADQLLEAYLASNPAARQEWDSTQKLEQDPRVTETGRFLRRSSLDELPQLWNVLIGDMSLVGPRPMLPEQRVLYPGEAYFRLRPGVTGFWQVAGRNKTTFEARAEFDTAYEGELSLWVDVKVLLRTVAVMLGGTGL